jgi:hypothetical protein
MRHGNEQNLIMRAAVTTEFSANRGNRLSNQRANKVTRPGTTQTRSTAERLDRLADVRVRAVARGKLLVADPNYPNKKTLRGVARVLARSWRG